jgi:hypothetical protein
MSTQSASVMAAMAHDPAGGVRRALAQPGVQHLTAVGAEGQQRVQAEPAGVAVAGTLLVVAVDLADRGVHVHGQRPVTGTRAGHPCSAQQLAEHAVELADVPEGERSQPRPDRGGRHHAVAEDRAGRPGPQRLDVVDAIATGEQRVDQGEQLATGPGRARTITQINELVGELLDPEPLGQRRGQQQPRGGDGVIVIEGDVDGVENDVRGSHRKGVRRLGVNDWLATVILAGQGTLFIIQSRSTDHPIGGCRLRPAGSRCRQVEASSFSPAVPPACHSSGHQRYPADNHGHSRRPLRWAPAP